MKHPMQYQTEINGVTRFVENKLVSWLIDQLPNGMNTLSSAHHSGVGDDDDYDQILQQIGYSTSGIPYRDLDKFRITDQNGNPEQVFEIEYKTLKDLLRPIMADLFNKHPDDLE